MTLTHSSTRLVAVALGVAVAVAVVAGAFAAPSAQAAPLTSAQVSSIISLLESFGADAATIANVRASLTGGAPSTGGGSSTGAACPVLSRSLQQGSSGADVKALQVFLNGYSTETRVAVSGAGSPGNESTYFGPATRSAVIKFQAKNNVSPIGIVGPQTRAAIAAVCGGVVTPGPGPTPTPIGGGLTIMASAQPANSLAPAGASRVPFTTFTLTNNSGAAVTVNGVTVQRTGLGVNANFSGVVLLDSNGIQVGTSKTLNSNNQAVLGDNFVLNAGQSMTFTVAGNIAASATAQSGQVISLQVVGVNTSVPVNGSMPINGASHTVNTNLTLGSVSTSSSSFDPGVAQTKNIGDTGVRFSGIRFTAGSAEDLKFYSIRWRQVGTASAADISNVMTNVNGTDYPTTVDSTGKYYTTVFPGGITIAKGNSVDVYVKGDLTGSGAASRNVEMNIDKVTDVYFVGQTYGYGVAPSGTWTPWFDTFVTTINAGTVTTIGKATEVPAQNVAVNVANQPLGGFVTDFKGEGVSITQMVVNFNLSSQDATDRLLTNVTLVDSNGAVVAGPVDAVDVAGTEMKVTFTDTIVFPASRKVYTLKGKIDSDVSNGQTIIASTTPSSWSGATGQVSGNSISITTGNFTMNTMTIKAADLGVTMSSQPASQNIVAGGQGITFANIQLDASASGEDVRLSSIPLRSDSQTGISGCQLFNGSTALNTGSNVPSSLDGTDTFNFDNALTISKGTVVTLTLKCNTSTSATGSYTWSVNSSDTWSATGVTSGNSITETVTTGNAGTMTVATGSLTVSVDSSSPSYMVVAGGSTGVTAAVVKLRAANEDISLTKLGLTLTNGTYGVNSGSMGIGSRNIIKVYVYDGATLLGTAVFTGSATTSTSTLTTVVNLPKDTDKLLTIKADLADIGTGQSGGIGNLVTVDPLNAEGTGASSGTTLQANATGTVAGLRLFNSYPTLALDTLSSSGVADGRLMRFKVTANAAGSVGIAQFRFSISTTSATVSNVRLYAYTDASYSSPVSGQGTSGQIGSTVTPTSTAQFQIQPSSNGNSAIQIPANATYYFELNASVTGVVSGSSVVTTLVGDSAFPTGQTAGYQALQASATSSNAFVWSGNSTSTSAYQSVDWSNGYGLPGFSASGLIQTRSN